MLAGLSVYCNNVEEEARDLFLDFFLVCVTIFLATKAALDTDIALYVGLSVAVAVVIVFGVLGVVMLRILRRKHGGHSPMFPVGASGKDRRQGFFSTLSTVQYFILSHSTLSVSEIINQTVH